MYNRSILLAPIGLLALAGCSTLVDQTLTPERYKQPALFNPLIVTNPVVSGNEPTATENKKPTGKTGQAGTDSNIQNEPVKTDPIFEVESPSTSLIVNTATKYDLIVKDSSCTGNASPTVTTNPQLTSEMTKNDIQYKYALNIPGANIPNPNSKINLTIRSCSSTNMSEGKAREKGLIKTLFLTASKVTYTGLSAKLNVWSEKDASDEFGPLFSSYFYAADAVFVNRNSDSILVYGANLTAKIRFRVAVDDVTKSYCGQYGKNPSDPKERQQCISLIATDQELANRFNWKEDFRPMSFSDILAIFTYNQEADPRKHQVELFKSFGKILTGAAVFTSSIDVAKGISFLTGIVLPEYEKQALWDMLLHVKNLESRSLKEVEEVHGNGQLHKVVFFPKRAIVGILPELPVYIAEIRPDEAKVDSTVITKEATLGSTP